VLRKLFILTILALIISTTIIKNYTKKLDEEIFSVKENIDYLNSVKELVQLEHNYLTSPDKLLELGYRPDYILGDLDSLALDLEDYSCKVINLNDQSKNDLEKGLEWCLKNEIKEVSLLGFSGLRDDHNAAALLFLKTFSYHMGLTMVTNFSTIQCINGKTRFKVSKGQVISIIPSNINTIIRTNGLKYELNDQVLNSPGNGISNVATMNEVVIESNDWIWVFLNHLK